MYYDLVTYLASKSPETDADDLFSDLSEIADAFHGDTSSPEELRVDDVLTAMSNKIIPNAALDTGLLQRTGSMIRFPHRTF